MNFFGLLLLSVVQGDSIRLCIEDAATGAPLTGVTVQQGRAQPTIQPGSCLRLPPGPVTLRRMGYRAVALELRESSTVGMVRLAAAPTHVDTLHIVASSPASAARSSASISSADARERGAGSLAQMIGMLPFAQVRSARGEAGVSVRGARREQVVVTLDGMPINDPATGVADAAELPLVAVRAATVTPGAAPLEAGPGAIGGVLALQSSTEPSLAVRTGAWGERVVEGSSRLRTSRALWNLGGSWRDARNDFPFRNTAGATGEAPLEHRVNNDERLGTIMASVLHERAQFALLASTGERGMVGPMNVRTYDTDRARTDRVLLRAGAQVGETQLLFGARGFALSYRDPARSVFDNDARAIATQLALARHVHGVTLTAGAGADAVRTSTGIAQARQRGWLAASHLRTVSGLALSGGFRLDAVSAAGVLPSLSFSAGRAWQQALDRDTFTTTLRLRAAQAVRVPTLYDLYFASPQRLSVRALDAERVTHDVDIDASVAWTRGAAAASIGGALVSRQVRDAIVWFPGNFSWSPANVGRERLHGAEGRAHAALGATSLALWGSWYDSRLESGPLRSPTPYVARIAGGAQAAARTGRTVLSSTVRAYGPRPFTLGPRDPSYELPAVALVDVAISRRVALRPVALLATLSLDNITNAAWQSVRGFPAPGRSWALAFSITTPTDR